MKTIRVFWPTSGIARDEGTAVGWRLKDTLFVVGIVEEWIHAAQDGQTAAERPLMPLARVIPVRKRISGGHSEYHTRPTVWIHGLLPVAFSMSAVTILYAPCQVMDYSFGIASLPDETPFARQKKYCPAALPDNEGHLDDLLELLSGVHAAQNSVNNVRPQQTPTLDRIQVIAHLAPVLLDVVISTVPLRPTTVDLWDVGLLFRKEAVRAFFSRLPLSLGVQCGICLPSLVHGFGRGVPACKTATSLLARCARALSCSARFAGVHFSPRNLSCLMNQVASRAESIVALAHSSQNGTYGRECRYTTAAIQLDLLLGLFAYHAIYHMPLSWVPSLTVLADPGISALAWLNEWPFGLKLNTGLSEFLCSSITSALVLWRDMAVPVLSRALPLAQEALCIASIGGLSFALTLAADMVAVSTAHLELCYLVTATLCRWSLSALRGLWDLFRGRRWNVLRHRTDSHAYDVDTLFLGTLLFTLTGFLAPTVFAYAGLFALIHLGIILVRNIIAIWVASLNCSAVTEVLTRMFWPHAIPAGIVFDVSAVPRLSELPEDAHPVAVWLELKSTPVGYGTILGEWWRRSLGTAKR